MIKPFIHILSAMLLLCSCSSFEMHFKEGASSAPPSLILINTFEVRDSNFDPHIAAEFSEALKFEFFKMGYPGRIIENKDKTGSTDDPEYIASLCERFKGDLFITGVVSRRETGFLTDRKVNSGIIFQVFSSRGVLLSEGYFMEPDATDIYLSGRRGARKFTRKLSSGLFGR